MNCQQEQLLQERRKYRCVSNSIAQFQMHLFEVAFFTAGGLYALLRQQELIFYFMGIVAVYILLSNFLPGLKDLSIRKKITAGTWTAPSQAPSQRLKGPYPHINSSKIIPPHLNPFRHQGNWLTLTQFSPTEWEVCVWEGTYIPKFEFIKYQQSDVSCVVDIDEGKDLAIVLVEDVHNKSVEEITQFIKGKAKDIKRNKGDTQHKQRMGIIKHLPAFVISLLLPVSKFIFHFLGISIKPLSVKANQFGAAVLTSIGMIGFENATAPLIGVIGCSLCVTLNAVCDKAVVENGEVRMGKVANVNFAIDARYVDTMECRNMLQFFMRVFEEPQKYLKKLADSENFSGEQQKNQRTFTLKLRTTQPTTQDHLYTNSAKLIPQPSM